MGVNHYLGTFDSEWDAAAIYGTEERLLVFCLRLTFVAMPFVRSMGPPDSVWSRSDPSSTIGRRRGRGSLRERKGKFAGSGTTACALTIYCNALQKDLAEGKIPEPPPKPEKKKKAAPKKKKTEGDKNQTGEGGTKKRKPKDSPATDKKRATKVSKSDTTAPTNVKGVQKVAILAPKASLRTMTEEDLMRTAARRATLSIGVGYAPPPAGAAAPMLPDIDNRIRPCVPGKLGVGRARFLGLSPSEYDWDIQEFCDSQELEENAATDALRLLSIEYAAYGINEQFASIMQGTFCSIGRASSKTQKLYQSMGLGTLPLGGSVGRIDCHIGGVQGSSSEQAAYIWFDHMSNEFRIRSESENDFVTLNGYEILPEQGSKPLRNEDVCSVGARVFVFLTS